MDWTIGHRHFCSLRVSGRLLFGFNLVLITELKTEHANGNSTPSLLVSIRVFSWRHSWNQNTEVLTESVDVELLSANCIRRKSRYRFFRSNSSIFSHVGIFSIFSFWSAALCGTSFRSNFPRQLSLWIARQLQLKWLSIVLFIYRICCALYLASDHRLSQFFRYLCAKT